MMTWWVVLVVAVVTVPVTSSMSVVRTETLSVKSTSLSAIGVSVERIQRGADVGGGLGRGQGWSR